MCNECDEPQGTSTPDPCADPCSDCGKVRAPGECDDKEVTPAELVVTGSDEDPCETDWRHVAQHPEEQLPLPPDPPVDPGTDTPTTFYSAARSLTRTRTNCQPGFLGGNFTTSLQQGAFTSLFSQADADQKAASWLSSVAQIRANQQGSCTDDPSNNTILSELVWMGESGCPALAVLTALEWGWGGGVFDGDCPAVTTPVLSGLEWLSVAGCEGVNALLYGLEWITITCT